MFVLVDDREGGVVSVDLAVLVRSFSCLVAALVTDDIDARDRAAIESLLDDATRVHAVVETVRLSVARRLERIADATGSVDPRETIAARGRSSSRDADRTSRRATVAEQMPELSDLLAEGAVSGDHLDVVAQALARLEPDERARLADQSAWIAAIAAHCTPEELARKLRQRVRQLSTDDGVARFERQRRATTLRSWIDPDTGMWRLAGEFDPETGARITQRLRATIDQLFSDGVPDTCPEDHRKHGHLQALALHDLITAPPAAGRRGRSRPPEFLVVIDQQTLWHGIHANSRIEIDGGFELPLDTLRRHACTANIIPVVLDSNGVAIDVGRAQRIATPAQRRAMRAMYATCAIPGCRIAFHDCQLHHILYWTNGGVSDLDNFVPLCSRHHHNAHEGGWKLHLNPVDHTLTITLPDGTTRANPPPHAQAA